MEGNANVELRLLILDLIRNAKSKEKGKKGKKQKSAALTNIGGVDLLATKSDDFMESLDMDDETSTTFEHLFVEEFDANDHKTQHIRRVSASPKNKFSDIVVKRKLTKIRRRCKR